MFSEHYDFQVLEDLYFPIDDYIPVSGNRSHKHEDVTEGISKCTANWDVVDADKSRRRGSDMLVLVNDEHYIWCSRTGMESAGNCIQMSKSTPEDLQFSILSTVFENVLSRKFGQIKHGFSKENFETDTFTVTTPREYILATELTDDELEEYYSNMADIIVELVSKFHDAETVSDLKETTEWFNEQEKSLFRESIGFTPTIASQVINEMESKNGWHFPTEELDAGKSFISIIHSEYSYVDDVFRNLSIFISNDEEVELTREAEENTILEKETYESKSELESILNSFMEYTPEKVFDTYD